MLLRIVSGIALCLVIAVCSDKSEDEEEQQKQPAGSGRVADNNDQCQEKL